MSNIKEDYERLIQQTHKSAGMKIVHHYFDDAMSRMKTRSGLTKEEWITKHREKRYVQGMIRNHIEKGRTESSGLTGAFQRFSGCGAMTSQIPMAIVDCINAYGATTVLDPCAGWGSRLLGATSQGCNYIGFDTNTTLEPVYKKMVEELPVLWNVHMKYEDSAKADLSGLIYDMVYTSPPYWYAKNKYPQERYEGMPEYSGMKEWVNNFLEPMFHNVMDNIQVGGRVCLNIPQESYEYLGLKCNEIRTLPTLGRRRAVKPDMVYVWYKLTI